MLNKGPKFESKVGSKARKIPTSVFFFINVGARFKRSLGKKIPNPDLVLKDDGKGKEGIFRA